MPVPLILIQGLREVKLPLHLEDVNAGYSNSFRPNSEKRKAHPDRFLWEKGGFNTMDFALQLAALKEGNITDAASLMRVVEDIASMAFPLPGENEIKSVRVQVGTWFSMKGLMNNWNADWSSPWDENGNPLTAKVSFTIQPTFDKGRKPTASNFSFRM